MFTGLSAFPLTPLDDDQVDEAAYARLVSRLAAAGVDSITALGSTGSYAYLDRDERRRVVRATLAHSGETPVIIGIGALRTSQVKALAHDAQQAGADAVLLAPVSYQSLTEDEVFGLYEEVTAELSVPLVVYDNPGTTRFTFSLELYARIAELPRVAAIKIPPPSEVPVADQLAAIREAVPSRVHIGISGDSQAAAALSAGSDAWYSVIAGTLPEPALRITRAAQDAAAGAADPRVAGAASERMQPVWELFAEHGSLRVTAAIAEALGLVGRDCLPRPVLGLADSQRVRVAQVIEELTLG